MHKSDGYFRNSYKTNSAGRANNRRISNKIAKKYQKCKKVSRNACYSALNINASKVKP